VRTLVPMLAAGFLLTLIFAWPAMVAARWLTEARGGMPPRFETAWPDRGAPRPEGHFAVGGRVERASGLFADRFRMFAADDGLSGQPVPAWPHGELVEVDRAPAALAASIAMATSTAHPYRLRSSVAGPPPLDEPLRWGRIDTDLCGFPFRCFVGEAWYPARSWAPPPGEVEYEPDPEPRGSVELGEMGRERLALPLRPIWPGFLANVLFWSAATWASFAIPQSMRARSRRRAGRCVACGQALADAPACPACDGARPEPDRLHPLRQPEMLYQTAYLWFVLVSALDIMLTWKILDKGGDEVNPIAREVIDLWGLEGAILFKFALVTWVVIACELIGRRRPVTGRRLAWIAVAISASPVVYSFALLLDHLVLRPIG